MDTRNADQPVNASVGVIGQVTGENAFTPAAVTAVTHEPSNPEAPVGWRWRPVNGKHWTYTDGLPSEEQRAWLEKFGHQFELVYTRPVSWAGLIPDGAKLLEIARSTGLRSAMHGVSPSASRELLSAFLRELIAASR